MKKYRVYGTATVTVTKEVWANDEDEALEKAYDALPYLIAYCGNGGGDKLIGVEGYDETVEAFDDIEYNDTQELEDNPDYFECPECGEEVKAPKKSMKQRKKEKLLKITPDKEKAVAYAKSFDFSAWGAELRTFLGTGADSMIELEKKEGKLKGYSDVTIQDLPGIYSIRPYTNEEIVTRDFLLKQKPDGIINTMLLEAGQYAAQLRQQAQAEAAELLRQAQEEAEQLAHYANACHVARKDEERYESAQERVVYHLQRLAVY